ncbi:hypothetical protein HMPREF1617_04564 [Escherichia coli 908675]|nr:putative DNA-binding transcriptional regulator [Escherichia coli MS 110-3]ESE10331.1 hypothetical protein HMPREF1617_04564 [Escherichia coli 908675]
MSKCVDSNNQIEPCLSRKSSEGKPQIFTTLRNIDLTLLTILKLHMSIKESLMQRKCLICPPRSEPWSFLSSIGRLKLTIHSFYCATRPSAARKTNSVSFKPISSPITCFAQDHRCYP